MIVHDHWVRKGRQGAPRLIDTPTENALRSLDQLRHLSRPSHRTGIGPPPPIAQVDRMGGCTSYLSFLDLPQSGCISLATSAHEARDKRGPSHESLRIHRKTEARRAVCR